MKPITENLELSGECWGGDWISPMGLDLQMNGGLGLSFTELMINQLPKLLRLLDKLWLDGVYAISPTFVSCKVHSLRNSFHILRKARKQHCHGRCDDNDSITYERWRA